MCNSPRLLLNVRVALHIVGNVSAAHCSMVTYLNGDSLGTELKGGVQRRLVKRGGWCADSAFGIQVY